MTLITENIWPNVWCTEEKEWKKENFLKREDLTALEKDYNIGEIESADGEGEGEGYGEVLNSVELKGFIEALNIFPFTLAIEYFRMIVIKSKSLLINLLCSD